jgi:diadenosine tetraphosphate (Ap4A) HIT family hydrolase
MASNSSVMTWTPSAWKSPHEWDKLRQGIDCSLCTDMHLDENPFSFKIIELQQSIVRLPKNQYMRGWTIVIFKRHANELFELSQQELLEYWQNIARVAKALDKIYQPVKINYCIFGHHNPHIHCHLLLHSYNDDPNKPIHMHEQEVYLSHDEYQEMIRQLSDTIRNI